MFNFSRRINGVTYYAGFGLSFLLVLLASLLSNISNAGRLIEIISGVFEIFIALLLFVYWLCLIRQRANDVGWHPLVLTLLAFWTPLFLVIGLIPGKKTQNVYGLPPRKGISLKP